MSSYILGGYRYLSLYPKYFFVFKLYIDIPTPHTVKSHGRAGLVLLRRVRFRNRKDIFSLCRESHRMYDSIKIESLFLLKSQGYQLSSL